MNSLPPKAALVQATLTALEGDPRILLAWVFGSVASSKDHAGSDVDVAVACERALSPEEQIALAQALERRVGSTVDLIDLFDAHGPVLTEAMSKGMMVIRKSPELYARLLKRIWFEEADYGPLRRRIQSERRRKVFAVNQKKDDSA